MQRQFTSTRPTVICEQCGTSFTRKRSELRGEHIFCSHACRSTFHNHLRKRTTEELFWRNVQKSDECWLWTAAVLENGYGLANDGTKSIKAHRLSYLMANGDIPKGQHVLHRCDNRRCVNPNHLFLGTHRDNMDDMMSKGRSSRGERSANATVTEAMVIEMRRLYDDGAKVSEIARQFEVGYHAVSKAVKRQSWRYLA